MKVEYQGNMISIYKLGQLSGGPLTSLYRAYHKGLRTDDEIIADLVCYKGKLITAKKLCRLTDANYKKTLRRMQAGRKPEESIADKKERRGATKMAKLSPTDVLYIYKTLFNRESTQTSLAKEFGVDPSTISDIWRHKHWGWLVAPLRYQLEATSHK